MISRWKISNFKSIGDAVDLPLAPLTIFCGPNSSGKSTFIKSILTVAQSLGSSAWEEPLVLNGRFVSLGHLEDVLHMSTKRAHIELGFTITTSTGEQTEVETRLIGRPAKNRRAADRLEVEVITTSITFMGSAKQPQRITLHRRPLNVAVSQEQERTAPLLLGSIERGVFNYEIVEPKLGELTNDPQVSEIIGASLSNILPGRVLSRVRTGVRDVTHELRQIAYALLSATGDGGRRDDRTSVDWSHTLSTGAMAAFGVVLRRLRYQGERDTYVEMLQLLAQIDTPMTIRQLVDLVQGKMHRNLYSGISVTFQPQGLNPRQMNDLARRLSGALPEIQQLVAKDPRSHNRSSLEMSLFPTQYGQITERVRQHLGRQIFYLGPLRDDPRVIYGIPSLPNQRDVGLKGEYTAAMIDTYGEREIVTYPVPVPHGEKLRGNYTLKRGMLREAIQAWMSRMGLAADVTTSETSRVGYGLQVRAQDLPIDLDLMSVGVGVSQVLPTITMALLAPTESILIFEQPEVHLHPKVQSVLGDFFLGMTACGKQCIVETHSEHLVNRIRRRIAESSKTNVLDSTRIYFVERHHGVSKFTHVAPNEYGAILDWPQGFFDEAEEEATLIMQAAMEKRQARMPRRPDREKQ
jgi:predicted ATPase